MCAQKNKWYSSTRMVVVHLKNNGTVKVVEFFLSDFPQTCARKRKKMVRETEMVELNMLNGTG